MVGRSRSPAARAGRTLGGTLDDVKAGARAGAMKGAAAGALGVLGAKVASAAQDVLSSNGDAKGKAQKSTGKALSGAAETARKKADVEGKAGAGNRLLQLLGRRTEEVTQTAPNGGTDGGWNVKVDVNDVPGLLLGGLAGFLSSPFSGPIGERIMNLRRDLGLGGEGSSESQYWPSQPQQSAPGTPGATASSQASADAG